MKQICKYLGIVVIVLGIIASFIAAKNWGVEVVSLSRFSSSSTELERNWLVTFIYFFLGLLATGISASILLGISEILERLDTVEITVETTLKASSANNLKDDSGSYWKCPQCGKSNPNYTGTCGCGCGKP